MAAVTAACAMKVARQPHAAAAAASGVVAARLPAWAEANSTATAMVKFRDEYHRRMTTRAPTIAPAKPMPSRVRPAVRPVAVSDAANTTPPATATVRVSGTVGRAPKRSSRTPKGICRAAKTKKKEPVTRPRSSGASASSSIRSGAITPMEFR